MVVVVVLVLVVVVNYAACKLCYEVERNKLKLYGRRSF